MRAGAFLFFSWALAMLPVGFAVAQTPATTIVRWQSGAPNSDLIVRNGLEIVLLDQQGLSVRATLRVIDDKPQVFLAVVNRSSSRIELVPSLVTFKLVAPEEKAFRYLDPDQVAAKIRNEAGIYAMVGFMLGARASYTVGQAGGAGFNSTTTDSGWVAVAEGKNQKAESIQDHGLRENTALPGESVGGIIFFGNPKHYGRDYGTGELESVLQVPVGGYVFEFPFYWDGRATAKPERVGVFSRKDSYTFDVPAWWKAKPASTILSEHSGQPQALAGAPTATVQSTTVMINSTPDGADVTVDGTFVGSTPSTLRLSPGDHGVSVEKSGFKPWQRKVNLIAGSSPTISATLEKDVVTSPEASSTKPKDEPRTTEGSPSVISDLSGSYSGEVTNTTLGVSAPFAIDIREENGGIYGCTTVQKPLVGSGGFQGTVNGSKVVFEATGKKLRIRFIGDLQGDALKGSYTVLSTQEHGNFQLRRVDSKAPAIGFNPAECRKD
jgi:hypothetical protein